MLKGRATVKGTSAYASRFKSLPAHFRQTLGLSVSSIGIGTYLGEHDDTTDRAYEQALAAALGCGINFIDTAVNYRFQRSERVIGKVLAELVANGKIRREEIIVASKGGYLTFDGHVPPNPSAYFTDKYVRTGIIAPEDVVEGSHCMTAKYIDAMIEMSRANLGLETIDVYYLHNPETQLSAVDRSEFLARVRRVFELLEARVADGKIAFYGTATWTGYRIDPKDRTYLSLDELVRVAAELGGEKHHFRMIQLPYNLAMPEALAASNQKLDGGQGTILQAAHAAGIAVCASASILQGQLAHRLPPIVGEAFPGLASDAQRAVQFVRSTPGIDVALVGMKSVAHVEEIVATAKKPPAPMSAIMKLFRKSEG
jgi:aryl-alcohol dehydrogenase-like predicted oxidoreductase